MSDGQWFYFYFRFISTFDIYKIFFCFYFIFFVSVTDFSFQKFFFLSVDSIIPYALIYGIMFVLHHLCWCSTSSYKIFVCFSLSFFFRYVSTFFWYVIWWQNIDTVMNIKKSYWLWYVDFFYPDLKYFQLCFDTFFLSKPRRTRRTTVCAVYLTQVWRHIWQHLKSPFGQPRWSKSGVYLG